jgi:hypothetical protein
MNNKGINPSFQGIQQVPYHVHNGIDSPLISSGTTSTSKTYGGRISSTGSFDYKPTGWTVSTGPFYTVTHNLATTNYAVVAGSGPGSSTGFLIISNLTANSFRVDSFGSTSSPSLNGFSFILTMN